MTDDILAEHNFVQVHRLEYEDLRRNVRTINDLGEQLTKTTLELKDSIADRERLAEKVTMLEDTNAVLRAELKRVTEELARRYE